MAFRWGAAWTRFGQQRRGMAQGWRNGRALASAAQAGALFFEAELCWLLGRDRAWLAETAAEYHATPAAWRHLSGLRSASKRTDGYAKTLDIAEGFALWALVKHLRPRVVVELGTQYGISARLWKEALRAYVPDHRLYLCDLVDKRRFIGDGESTMLEGDARERLKAVFAQGPVDILHNDAHPYDLIHWSLAEGQARGVGCFTFHDVGGYALRGGPFKPESASLPVAIKRQYAEEYGPYGTWERHCMAEAFDARIVQQDAVDAGGWRLQIFDSFLGFGVALRSGHE